MRSRIGQSSIYVRQLVVFGRCGPPLPSRGSEAPSIKSNRNRNFGEISTRAMQSRMASRGRAHCQNGMPGKMHAILQFFSLQRPAPGPLAKLASAKGEWVPPQRA